MNLEPEKSSVERTEDEHTHSLDEQTIIEIIEEYFGKRWDSE